MKLPSIFRALGPALIVASVVLGPGSILTNSRVGATYGIGRVWVLLMAAGLMMGMVALSARLGVVYSRSLCDELAARLGRPVAILVGLTIFMVCAGYQSGNDLGVLVAFRPWSETWSAAGQRGMDIAVLTVLNGLLVLFLFSMPKLYVPIERLMMVLVGIMIVAFCGNFIYLLTQGLPSTSTLLPEVPAEQGRAAFLGLIGLIGTTFSVAGAFYQAYLVKEKGWGLKDLKQGVIDSITGISVLATISLVIMLTSAVAFAGSDVRLSSAADVPKLLEPLFGSLASVLFSVGIFAASFSSFLVNAMIGGAMLADGFGWDSRIDSKVTRVLTCTVLIVGMLVALFTSKDDPLSVVVFLQATVVLGFPLLAVALIYLASSGDLTGERKIPRGLQIVAWLGLLVVSASAVARLLR